MASATLSVSAIAPPGWKFTVFSNPDISTPESIAYGQSPTVVTSDIVVFREFATKDGVTTTHSITISTNGIPVVYAESDSASMSFLFFFWDESNSAYGTTAAYNIAEISSTQSSSSGGGLSSLTAVYNIWQWFYVTQGGTQALGERVQAYLKERGYSGTTNSMLYDWLQAQGYTGGLTEMITKFERDYTHRYS